MTKSSSRRAKRAATAALSILSMDHNDCPWAPPSDPYDFDFWITVTVGDEGGGSNFQVHVCSPLGIRRTQDKRACFILDEWQSEEDMLERLQKFMESQIQLHETEDPFAVMSRHWIWEYAGMS